LPNSKYRNVDVVYTGNETLTKNINDAYKNHTFFVKLIPVNDQIEMVMNDVIHSSNQFIKSLLLNEKIETPISCNCKNCEYTLTDTTHNKSGFDECWGELAKVETHILNLGQLGNVNKKTLNKDRKSNGELGCIDERIKDKKVSLYDIPIELVTSENGVPFYNDRPFYQLTQKSELILPELKAEMINMEYPLHFIDFETIRPAIPFHERSYPYQQVAFQFSHHVVEKNRSIRHEGQWISLQRGHSPNEEFLKNLQAQLSQDGGTVLHYAHHEQQVLGDMADQVKNKNAPLSAWARELMDSSKVNHGQGKGRMVDLQKILVQRYYHPLAGGSNSLKKILI
jgi:hypothetical protein